MNISPFLIATLQLDAGGEVKAPKNIIQTLPAALTVANYLRTDNLERIRLWAVIEGLIQGNPPYDQDDLDANGLSHVTNYNNFKGNSYFKRTAQLYWNLTNSTQTFIKVVLNSDIGLDPRSIQRFARIMSEELDYVLRKWPDFFQTMGQIGAYVTKIGICPVFFSNEKSWMFEVVEPSRTHLPNQTLSLPSKMTQAVLESEYTLQELYQIYENLQEGDAWNKQALGDYLILRANVWYTGDDLCRNPMDLQIRLQNNDAKAVQFYSQRVRLINLLQREYDGKVSHYIFARYNNLSGSSPNFTYLEDFLYFVDRQYDKFEDALVMFTSTPGETYIHSNLGIGHKMLSGVQAVNMLDNATVDMAIMASTPIVRSLGSAGRNLDPIRFIPGVATDIGASEFEQNNLGANISQLVAASQYLTQQLDVNAANGGDDPSQPDRHQGSVAPSQAKMKAFTEFGLLKTDVAHFYNTADTVFEKVVIRMLTMGRANPGYEYAKEWKERSIRRGVPKELFDSKKKSPITGLPYQFKSVKMSRVAGDGSTTARIMGLEGLAPIAGSFDVEAQTAYRTEMVEAYIGPDYVDVFIGDGMADEMQGGSSTAALENDIMELGKAPRFSPDNDQKAHFVTHLQWLIGIVQAVKQQQLSPVDADGYFKTGIPHIQEHANFMQQSPLLYAQLFEQSKEMYGQVIKFAQLNRANAEKMVQAALEKQQNDAAKTQQVMDDKERKDFVARTDAERKDYETAQKLERTKDANETRGEIMKEKVRTDADIKREKVQMEGSIKQQEKAQLAAQSQEELQAKLREMGGETPSNVDFES